MRTSKSTDSLEAASKADLPGFQAPLLVEPRWRRSKSVAFRFCCIYFGLFCILTSPLNNLVPPANVDPLMTYWPISAFVAWSAAALFHVTVPMVFTGSGSGDKMSDWIFQFWCLVFAVVGTALWSALDRKRANYDAGFRWFRLFIRLMVAGELIGYGLWKIIPVQMPAPHLSKLIETFGQFSPMGVLWSSIGASPAYEIFAGSAELLAGILLILPRTSMLGALIGAADMTQVFILNMAYDVPVKILSSHLLLMCLFLLAPDVKRLANVFFFDRGVAPSASRQLFHEPAANRIALSLQVALGIFLVVTNLYALFDVWKTVGGQAPKSTIYGIWSIQKLTDDGRVRPALVTDRSGLRRIIFEAPDTAAFEHMDDSFTRYRATIEEKHARIVFRKSADKHWMGRYTYRRIGADRMTLAGTMDGHTIAMRLQLLDLNKMVLVSTGFHWVQDYGFNR